MKQTIRHLDGTLKECEALDVREHLSTGRWSTNLEPEEVKETETEEIKEVEEAKEKKAGRPKKD